MTTPGERGIGIHLAFFNRFGTIAFLIPTIKIHRASHRFSGYFSDLDGYYWEVAWGPMFEFIENGDMKFKESV